MAVCGRPSASRPLLANPRVQLAIAVGGLLLAVGGGLLLATSDFLVDPVAYGIQTGVMIFGAVLAGLVWVRRRPGNRVGPLLLAMALVTAVVPLQGVDSAYLHSVGVLVEPVYFLLTYVVVFAFPQGERIGRAERLILAAITLYFMVGFVPWMFFSPVVPGGAPLAGCDSVPGQRTDDRGPTHGRRRLRHRPLLGGDRDHDGDDRGPRVPAGDGEPSTAAHAAARLRAGARPHGPDPRVPRVRRRHPAARPTDVVGRRMDDRVRPLGAAVRVPARDRAGEPVRQRCVEAADRRDRLQPGCRAAAADRRHGARRSLRRARVQRRRRARGLPRAPRDDVS